MAKFCVCVNCGFRHEAETNRKSTPKLWKDKVNPFATRGREEFLELVAKVEEKKQMILKRSGTDNALMVRFMHSDDNKLKPIIVRAKSDIGQKSNTQAGAAPTLLEHSAVEKTQEKKSLVEEVKLGRFKFQQRCHDYLVVAVISASLLLIFLEILWQLRGAKTQ